MTSLVVSEVFGPTVQGEGPAAGRRAVFVRLGGCNLTCTWCDSAFTWDAKRFSLREQLTRRDLHDVIADVLRRGADLVVISGGEPLLQQGRGYGLIDLAGILMCAGREVHVETNGTIAPADLLTAAVRLFVVSPKLAHSGVAPARAVDWAVLRRFGQLAVQGRAVLKVVCQRRDDLADAAAIGATAGFPRPACWIMPEGTTAEQVTAGLQLLTEPAVALGLNVSGRQHVMTWGNERGR
jgi:7-carboxy-7-deazaguanine synthase